MSEKMLNIRYTNIFSSFDTRRKQRYKTHTLVVVQKGLKKTASAVFACRCADYISSFTHTT